MHFKALQWVLNGSVRRTVISSYRSLPKSHSTDIANVLSKRFIPFRWSFCQTCRRNLITTHRASSVRLMAGNSSSREYSSRSNPHSKSATDRQKHHTSLVMYITAVGIAMLGGAYAGVPLYRMFCAATGLGGNTSLAHDTSGKIASLEKIEDRLITVKFNADVASSMQWNFKPQQTEIKVYPGETALAFYTARNPTKTPIVGISTYSVIPYDAGQYFNKIQCFCFEEQILNPDEEVDMPVFFYIDPDYVTDPRLEVINEITLSYTFFEAKDGMTLPLPGYAQKTH